MQKQVIRLQWTMLLVALRVVGVVALCFVVLSFIAFHFTPRAYAANASLLTIAGSASSSPSTGPVGTAIIVTGSGWSVADGTPVAFGYEVNEGNTTECQTVSDSQNGTLNDGNFRGWFRWPSGTALATFQVCAMLGSSIMTVAGSFTVLSSNPPSVAISPSSISPNTSATITANNYFPAGTQVNFLWMAGNTIVDNLHSVASDTSGKATLTFTVPNFSIASGSYSINAYTGSGQPVALSSSTNFTFHALVVPPSPTPNPSPTALMTPSPTVTQSVTPTSSATVAASATATVGATATVSASPTAVNNSTASNNGDSNTGAPTTSSSDNTPLIAATIAILLGLLLSGVIAVLLIRRRQQAASEQARVIPPRMPNSVEQASWSNSQGVFMNNGAGNPNLASFVPYNPVTRPDAPLPPLNNTPTIVNMPAPPMPVPVPVGAEIRSGTVGNDIPTISASADPALDAMRREAQAGLFVAPRPFQDERSQ